jgi:hypothetical protein
MATRAKKSSFANYLAIFRWSNPEQSRSNGASGTMRPLEDSPTARAMGRYARTPSPTR